MCSFTLQCVYDILIVIDSLELEMEWDPLCGSHDLLVATQSSLSHLLHHPTVNTYHWINYQETFTIEPFLLNISECIWVVYSLMCYTAQLEIVPNVCQ